MSWSTGGTGTTYGKGNVPTTTQSYDKSGNALSGSNLNLHYQDDLNGSDPPNPHESGGRIYKEVEDLFKNVKKEEIKVCLK